MPALFAFTGIKRKGYESCDSQYRGDQEKWRFKAGRKIRQHRIQPKEEEIWLRGSLNDRWVRLASRSVGSEHCCANGNRGEDRCGEESVLPHSSRYEWPAILLRQFVVFRKVRSATNNAARHRPFVDAELDDHPHMKARERQQHSRNNEDVKCEESGKRRPGNDRSA